MPPAVEESWVQLPAGDHMKTIVSEQNTQRAQDLYKIQRKDEAPDVRSDAWIPYLRSQGIEVPDQS